MSTAFFVILTTMAAIGGYIGGRIHAAYTNQSLDEALASLGQTVLLVESYIIVMGDLAAEYRDIAQKALDLPDTRERMYLKRELQTLDNEMATYAASIEDYISSKKG